MNSIFKDEIKQNIKAVVPIAIIVLILNFFRPVATSLLINFLIACLGVILGLAIFLSGVDLSISKIGSMMGDYVGKLNKLYQIILFGIFIGFIISMAEPDLLILAKQISGAIGLKSIFIVVIISLGVGIMLSVGLFRIFREIKIKNMMLIIYMIIFAFMLLSNDFSHSMAFDASGATTGAITTPFIIAIGLGISKLKGGHKQEEDSFGLVGIASTGPIIAGLIMTLKANSSKIIVEQTSHINPILSGIRSSTFAILPIIFVFFVMNHFVFKKKNLKTINLGLFYTYIGLIIFIASVEGGFMDLARQLGENYSDFKFLPLVGFILGLLVVLAEPAVYVLSEQVEEVTGGSIHQKTIQTCLSIGVAFAVSLAMLKLNIEGFKLWMLVVPVIAISLILSRKVAPIFVGCRTQVILS
ncbi:MAG: DUF1538 family protein [Peptoniphilaceae bacterium]|nr:DUF1538 family protein [Peptoniphilaceae bacterium]MDY6018895.1 DUF1538 family protein [Anaerococcus sp.]